MIRLRPLALLTLTCSWLLSLGTGVTSAAPLEPSAVGSIASILEPTTRQVVQRRDDGVGCILFVGTCSGPIDGFQAQSTLQPGMAGIPLSWTALEDVTISGAYFAAIFRQPAGGFYNFQIRPVYRGQPGSAAVVNEVGVGEVFITAGQSNSTNWGLPTGFAPDLRVSAFNDGPKHGLDPTFPGASWQYGIDPQPVVDISVGGSTWPTMASDLAEVMGVPIGLYAAGYGGTDIQEWLPGSGVPATGVGPQIPLFTRMVGAIEYFNLRGGVRAVLWIQGENDYILDTDPKVYQASLQLIIQESRKLSGVPIKWMVAQTTTPLTTGNLAERQALEAAQAGVVDGVLTFPGPDVDNIPVPYRYYVAGGPLHFTASGLELLGGYWATYVYNIPGFLAKGSLPPY